MSPESLISEFEAPHRLSLRFAGVPIRVKTNDPEILARLASYFRPYVITGPPPLAEVSLIQGSVPLSGEFVDVVREGGRRPKEATQEVAGGRLVLKRATGVLIGLRPGGAFAVGDIRRHLNQGINLVNNCYAKVVLRRGHVLLHASAVTRKERTAVLAGPPARVNPPRRSISWRPAFTASPTTASSPSSCRTGSRRSAIPSSLA